MLNIREYDFKNKKVIIRVDFNVPIKNGTITDTSRIDKSLETINFVLSKGGKIILLSHLGRVKTEEDKQKNTLLPVFEYLKTIYKDKIAFIKLSNDEDILLLENTRWEDLEGKKESSNNVDLSKYWAAMGDVFINDAFGTSHRAHASNVGIAKILPSMFGFLVEKEIEFLSKLNKIESRPYTIVMGGAKVSDKIKLIENLLKKADYILIGGAMANTFLKAKGYDIRESMYEIDYIDYAATLIKEYNKKIILPVDVICASNIDSEEIIQCDIENIDEGLSIFDIGYKTVNLFEEYINRSSIIFMNGPMGVFEKEQFSKGTKDILKSISNSQSISVIGGGDSAAAAKKFGLESKFSHVSTGGGASLEMLEGSDMPGIDVILNEKQ